MSHRISSIKHADEIIVLDEGRIVERGAHDELVAERGLYANIYERQLLEAAMEDSDSPDPQADPSQEQGADGREPTE